MKKTVLAALCIGTCLSFQTAWACSRLPPESGFIAQNDQNRDTRLNKQEWQQGKVHDYFVHFALGKSKDFAKLDQNRDGFLTESELSEKVRYKTDPCAWWYEEIRRRNEEEQKLLKESERK